MIIFLLICFIIFCLYMALKMQSLKTQSKASIRREQEKAASDSYNYYYKPSVNASLQSSVATYSYQSSSESLIQKRKDDFDIILDSMPRESIVINPNSTNIRHLVSEMPEIHYAGIGEKFNEATLSSFIVIDTETTGLSAGTCEIVEVSAIKLVDWIPVSCFTTLIKPRKKIPEDVIKIHGITNEMVASAPALHQVIDHLNAFVGKLPLVGYNLPFDLKFLYVGGFDLDTKRKYFDALAISRRAFKGVDGGYSLTNMCAYNGIWRSTAHRSLSDCYATALVLKDAIETIKLR